MEYHSPAACQASGSHAEDKSRTWCFAGDIEAVREVVRQLLNGEEIE